MHQCRKDQLNAKLHQIYEASGRIEGIIENLLQERFLGHIYFIHQIKGTKENPQCYEEYAFEESKDYTLVEFGLYQEGEACIGTFDVPVSNKQLEDFESRIDTAYYRWMQREPSMPHMRYEYYRDLLEVSMNKKMQSRESTKEEFMKLHEYYREMIIRELEWQTFLPPSEAFLREV